MDRYENRCNDVSDENDLRTRPRRRIPAGRVKARLDRVQVGARIRGTPVGDHQFASARDLFDI